VFKKAMIVSKQAVRVQKLQYLSQLQKSNSFIDSMQKATTYLIPNTFPGLQLTIQRQIFFSTESRLLDFFPDTSPLDAIAVFEDSPNSETEILQMLPLLMMPLPQGGKMKLVALLLVLFPQRMQAV